MVEEQNPVEMSVEEETLPDGPISQEELKDYHKLNQDIKIQEDKLKKRRQNFLDRVGLEQPIEDGPFVLKISNNSPRLNAGLIIEEIASRWGEDTAKEVSSKCKKGSESKRVTVEPK